MKARTSLAYHSGPKPPLMIRAADPYIVLLHLATCYGICARDVQKEIDRTYPGGISAMPEAERFALIKQRWNDEMRRITDRPINQKDRIEGLPEYMEQQEAKVYLDAAWQTLTQDQRDELSKRLYTLVMKHMNGPQLEPRIREVILRHASEMADEEIARHEETIRQKVMAEIEARWQAQVESLVASRVDAAIAKIKAEIVKP